jgi:sulfide:quinone oxidoreductase
MTSRWPIQSHTIFDEPWRVIICGAGFGGIAAALNLRRADRGVEIVLVDRRDDFVMGLRKTWAALGISPLEAGRRRLRDLAGVTLEIGEIEAIDAAARSIRLGGRTIDGDALVLALGADRPADAIPGLAEFAINAWDRAQVERAQQALAGFDRGRLVIGIFGLPYACPPGPFELAMLCRERLPAQIEITVFSPAALALPVVGAVESAKIDSLLAERRIDFLPAREAVRVEPHAVHFADGSSLGFELLLAVPRHGCPQVLIDAGLAGAGGWVEPYPRTMETTFPDVYAVGDCTVIMLANGLPLPKAGIFAEAQGDVVASRIAARLAGREPDAAFSGDGYCFVETGGGEAATARGSFLADPVDVRITQPSVAQLIEKQEFERSRLASWFPT